MAKVCGICGKRGYAGRSITRRSLAKKKGGVGQHVTGVTARRFAPNLQRIRVSREGWVGRMLVCTQCIKSGKVEKPKRRTAPVAPPAEASAPAS